MVWGATRYPRSLARIAHSKRWAYTYLLVAVQGDNPQRKAGHNVGKHETPAAIGDVNREQQAQRLGYAKENQPEVQRHKQMVLVKLNLLFDPQVWPAVLRRACVCACVCMCGVSLNALGYSTLGWRRRSWGMRPGVCVNNHHTADGQAANKHQHLWVTTSSES